MDAQFPLGVCARSERHARHELRQIACEANRSDRAGHCGKDSRTTLFAVRNESGSVRVRRKVVGLYIGFVLFVVFPFHPFFPACESFAQQVRQRIPQKIRGGPTLPPDRTVSDSPVLYSVARSDRNAIQDVSGGQGGYRYVSKNFVVENAPTPELAREFAESAETHRRELAVLWFGREMPNWSAPCPVSVRVGNYGATGETSFIPAGGEVYGWSMKVQGTRQRIVDSVLPHEISHMIFASAFRRKIPRWIDEGAATSLEHESEKSNYRRMLLEFVDPRVARTIPFNRMVEIEEYPNDFWPLYAQGNSVVEFLIAQRGHRELTRFLATWFHDGDWNAALRKHYGYDNMGDLQIVWVRWIEEGFPVIESFEPAWVRLRRVGDTLARESRPEAVVRGTLAGRAALSEDRDFDSIPIYEPVIPGKRK